MSKSPQPEQRVTALKLLELQRHSMLMYTSCGWFFDDISGIETVQILQYAGRAMQLAREVLGVNHEPEFIAALEAAKSNVPEHENGARIYERQVMTTMLDLQKVAAHYAISSLFEEYEDETSIYCYSIKNEDYRKLHAGKSVLLTGRCTVTSEITGESDKLTYAVLHLGTQDFNCGVRRFVSDKAFKEMVDELHGVFESGAFADVVRLLDTAFGSQSYSLRDLFRDEQRAVLETLLAETLESFEASYRRMFEDNRILMSFLKEAGIPIPKAFYTAAEFILNLDLKTQLLTDFDPVTIEDLLKEVKTWKVTLDREDLEFTLKSTLDARIQNLYEESSNIEALVEIDGAVKTALTLPFRHNLWLPQNLYYRMAKTIYKDFARRGKKSNICAEWVEIFRALGEKLNFNLEAVLPERSRPA
jgi:hypothetical protein